MSAQFRTVNVNLPNGPEKSPWDQTKAWVESPIEFWRECQAEFGDTFTLQLGSLGTTVLFCDPQAVQQIFALPADHFVCGPFNAHYQEIMGSSSLLALDGPAHREQRRLISPALTPNNDSRWGDGVRQSVQHLCRSLPTDSPIDLRPVLHQIAFQIVVDLLFADQHADVRHLLQNILLKDLTKDYGSWSPWARFTKWHPLLRQQLSREITSLRNRTSNESNASTDGPLFARLVAARDTQGNYLPDTQIHDHVFTMLIAGVDPSTIATLWLMYWVHRDADTRDRLKRSGPDLREAACRESLRMIPVVTTPTGRRLLKPTVIAGHEYPPDVTLLPCTYLVHRRPELYPNPEQYLPERFLNRTFKPYEYFPFGGGNRTCPGARLAMATMHTILETVLRYGKLEWIDDGPIVPIRHGTLLAPSQNLKFRIVEWNDD